MLLGDARERPTAPDAEWEEFRRRVEDRLTARVVAVNRLTPTIVEVVVRAPAAAAVLRAGPILPAPEPTRRTRPVIEGSPLLIEPLALTGAWVDAKQGLLSMIALEIGSVLAALQRLEAGRARPRDGPDRQRDRASRATRPCCSAAAGSATPSCFSIGKKARALGNRVIYFAGYKKAEDFYKREDIEAAADVLVLSVDHGETIPVRRPDDREFVGNIVEAMVAYGSGALGRPRSASRTSSG